MCTDTKWKEKFAAWQVKIYIFASEMITIDQLYNTLKERKRPEDVAEMIVELLKDSLSVNERAILEKAAKGSLARNVYNYTSMLQMFAEAIGAGKQIG